jgi:hypothetical protein
MIPKDHHPERADDPLVRVAQPPPECQVDHCELCLRNPVNLSHLCLEAPRMSLPMLYSVVGVLFVNAIYFVSVRNNGPSAAAGDTKGKRATCSPARVRASRLLAKVWPSAVAGIAKPGAVGAAGDPHEGGEPKA